MIPHQIFSNKQNWTKSKNNSRAFYAAFYAGESKK